MQEKHLNSTHWSEVVIVDYETQDVHEIVQTGRKGTMEWVMADIKHLKGAEVTHWFWDRARNVIAWEIHLIW